LVFHQTHHVGKCISPRVEIVSLEKRVEILREIIDLVNRETDGKSWRLKDLALTGTTLSCGSGDLSIMCCNNSNLIGCPAMKHAVNPPSLTVTAGKASRTLDGC
jgi:hypothetical protein